MLALDTNVIVRYLTRDDPRQAARAAAVIDSEEVFVATTVLLETEWMLRSSYGLSPAQICASFRTLAGQPTVTLQDSALVSAALAWAEQGMDFADSLHLAASSHCSGTISFDGDLAKIAKKLGAGGVRRP